MGIVGLRPGVSIDWHSASGPLRAPSEDAIGIERRSSALADAR
jgi:hypothetical protein